jgi:Domain of unknown function (DUF4837)
VTVFFLTRYSIANFVFMNRIILFAIILASAVACSKKEKNLAYLPKATGKPGDIILIMDSVQWKGELGVELRKIFRKEVPGLPQSEPMFNLIWVHPSRLKLLTQIRNLVYVFTLDQESQGSKTLRRDFTPETLAKIKSDTSFFRFSRQDEYAKGQEVMYLFGDTEQNLIRHLRQVSQQLIDYFNDAERKRLEANLFSTKATQGVASFLRKEYGMELHVPVGYVMADQQDDFIWLRQIEAEKDKDVFITWKPYESEYQLLPDSIVAWRDATARKYLFEDPENPISYLVTERDNFDIIARQVSLNKHFAMEIRALWRTNNLSMGGPYVGYALVDQPRGRLYYLEGFAYAPGKDKREIIRELETILATFRTSEDLGIQTK